MAVLNNGFLVSGESIINDRIPKTGGIRFNDDERVEEALVKEAVLPGDDLGYVKKQSCQS